jgi:hypothetical protein
MSKKGEFIELSRAQIKPQRNIVISKNIPNNNFILGQQVMFTEGAKVTPIFLSGAINIDDVVGLYNLRDALNEAIQMVEDNNF